MAASPVRKQYFAGLSRNTFLLAFASLFADISTEMLYPVLPMFLTQTLKASGSVVGLVDGFAQAAQNIVQGFSGALSDKLQKRKAIALVGYLLAAIAKPLMGLSTAWQGVFGARLLDRDRPGRPPPVSRRRTPSLAGTGRVVRSLSTTCSRHSGLAGGGRMSGNLKPLGMVRSLPHGLALAE